jgi:hypothetical protein
MAIGWMLGWVRSTSGFGLRSRLPYGSPVVTLAWKQSKPTSPLGMLPVTKIKMESHQSRLWFF